MNIKDLKGYKVVNSGGRATAIEPKPEGDFLDKATGVVNSIFPGKQVGEAIGTLGGYALSKNKDQYDLSAPSPIQVAGDVAAGAATIAGFKGAGTGGSLAANVAKSAGLGGVMSGGKTLAEGGDLGEVAQSAAIGGAIGGALPLAGAGLEQIGNGFKALPQRLIRSATGQSKTDLLAGKDISKYVLENRKIGSADKLIRDAEMAIDKADEFINAGLKSETTKRVPVKDIIDDISSSINNAGGEIDDAGVRSILEGLAPQVKKTIRSNDLSLLEANRLRSQLDKTLGNRAFINSQLPYNKGVLMDFTNALREQVKGMAPEGTRAAFNTYAKELKLKQLLEAKIAGGSRTQIIGLGDLISATGGGVVGGLPGAVATAAGKRALQSTPVLTGGAVAIDALNKSLAPILKDLAPGTQTAIMTAISDVLAQD